MPERLHGEPRPPESFRPKPQPDEVGLGDRRRREIYDAVNFAAAYALEAAAYLRGGPEGRQLERLYAQLKRVESNLLKGWERGAVAAEPQQPERPRPSDEAKDRGPKRAPGDAQEGQPTPEFWPVVRVVNVLQTGAIVEVEWSHKTQTGAEIHSLKGKRRATLNQPLAHEWARGDKLVVAESEMSPKLKKLVAERRLYELEYGSPEQPRQKAPTPAPPQTLSELSLPRDGPSLHPGAEVWSRRFGENTRASLFERVDEYGEKHSTVFITQDVRQADGTVREVTTEHDRKALLALHAKLTNQREREPNEEQSLELGVWFGYKQKPAMGEEVTVTKQQGIFPAPNRIDPKGYNAAYPPDGPPRYVVCTPTEEPGVYRVLGHTLDRELAETTMRKMEVKRGRQEGHQDSAVLQRLANLVAKHEPNDAHLKEGLNRLVKILAATRRNGHSQPQRANGHFPQQGEDDASRHARGRHH